MEKKNTGLVITIVVLVVLLLGLLGYVCYDKFYLDKKGDKTNNDSVQLVEGNSFKLESIACVNENNTCAKRLKVAYNNKNHDIKLVKKLVDNTKYVIDLYIDNALVDSIDGGLFYDWGDGSKPQDWIKNLDGYVYVVDSKYLAIVSRKEYVKPSWYLNYYNGNNKINSDAIGVVIGGIGFGVDDKSLNDLNSIVFDGKTLTYWKEYCGNTEKAIDNDHLVIEEHHVTIVNDKVNDVISSFIKNAEGGGASTCGVEE